MRILAAAILVLIPLASPTALAAPCGAEAALGSQGGALYLAWDPANNEVQVWSESNHVPGFQRAPCEDAGGSPREADTYHGTLPLVTCTRPICLF